MTYLAHMLKIVHDTCMKYRSACAFNVWDFENDLKQKLRKKAENDVEEMLKIKIARLGTDATTINSWEAGYY